MEKIGHLFRSPLASRTAVPETPAQPRPELEAQALVERIDILTEKKGKHYFTIGFHESENQDIDNAYSRVHAEDAFYAKLHRDITGSVEVYRNNNQYMTVNYIDNSGKSWIGNRYHIAGFGYPLGDIDIDWYSFTPNITSFKEGTFGFGFQRSYTTM